MNTQRINHAAVIVLVIAFQVVSTLWYSPAVFAERWMHYLGKTFADFNGESIRGILFSLLFATGYCYLLAWLFLKLNVKNSGGGLLLGFSIAMAAFVLPTFTQDAFSLRPLGLSLINSGNIILNSSMAGLVLGAWRKTRTLKPITA